MKRIKLYMLLFIISFLWQACKKYEEGPLVSIYSKRYRLANKWKISKADLNGTLLTAKYKSWVLEFTNKGTVINSVDTFKFLGYWQLNNSEKDFDISYYDSLGFSSNEILKLKKDEFWYRDKKSNIKFELTPF